MLMAFLVIFLLVLTPAGATTQVRTSSEAPMLQPSRMGKKDEDNKSHGTDFSPQGKTGPPPGELVVNIDTTVQDSRNVYALGQEGTPPPSLQNMDAVQGLNSNTRMLDTYVMTPIRPGAPTAACES